MAPSRDSSLFDALDRQARRRTEGLATPSLLVGEPEQAWRVWTSWVHRRGLRPAFTPAEHAAGMVSAWAQVLVRGRSLIEDAERFAHRCQPAATRRELHFQGKTVHERHVLLDSLVPPASAPGAWALCRQLLERPLPPAPGTLPEVLREGLAREPLAMLQALVALVPEGAPALGLRVLPGATAGVRALAQLCGLVPSLPVACVLSPEDFAGLARQGESRALALLREGRLDVVPLPEDSPERARSKAEWALYQGLHTQPSTAGLFHLNIPVKTAEDERPWEVDLLCEELKLAVEVDGYFHLRDPEAFRRDRRKDVALQRAGYFVFRVLAEDVTPRLKDILEELETVIAHRRQELAHG